MESVQTTTQNLLSTQIKSLFKIGNFEFSPTYLQAAAIVFLTFLLIFTLARLRKLYVRWSFSGAHAFLFIGFLLALIIEGFFIIGGRTVITEILGWKNPPKPVASVLDFSKEKIADVLGVKKEIPTSYAQTELSSEEFYTLYDSLAGEEKEKLKELICTP